MDVAKRADAAHRLPLAVERDQPGRDNPALLIGVGAADAELGVILACFRGGISALIFGNDPFAIVGMDQRGEQAGSWGGAGRQAENLKELVRPSTVVCRRIDVPDADAGGLGRQSQALLPFAERAARARLAGEVDQLNDGPVYVAVHPCQRHRAERRRQRLAAPVDQADFAAGFCSCANGLAERRVVEREATGKSHNVGGIPAEGLSGPVAGQHLGDGVDVVAASVRIENHHSNHECVRRSSRGPGQDGGLPRFTGNGRR